MLFTRLVRWYHPRKYVTLLMENKSKCVFLGLVYAPYIKYSQLMALTLKVVEKLEYIKK